MAAGDRAHPQAAPCSVHSISCTDWRSIGIQLRSATESVEVTNVTGEQGAHPKYPEPSVGDMLIMSSWELCQQATCLLQFTFTLGSAVCRGASSGLFLFANFKCKYSGSDLHCAGLAFVLDLARVGPTAAYLYHRGALSSLLFKSVTQSNAIAKSRQRSSARC